jgi:hypothetical protein
VTLATFIVKEFAVFITGVVAGPEMDTVAASADDLAAEANTIIPANNKPKKTFFIRLWTDSEG